MRYTIAHTAVKLPMYPQILGYCLKSHLLKIIPHPPHPQKKTLKKKLFFFFFFLGFSWDEILLGALVTRLCTLTMVL